jgi:hypothetical protein
MIFSKLPPLSGLSPAVYVASSGFPAAASPVILAIMESKNRWYVYILRCSDNTLYTG